MIDLTAEQRRARDQARRFVDEYVAPHAARYDDEEQIPRELVERIATARYLGALLPVEDGGGGLDPITYGVVAEEFGRASASVHGLINVHHMAAVPILKWGNRELRSRWAGELASGRRLAAFAITEPDVGSDAAAVQTTATQDGDAYVLAGSKKWITFGQLADVFLVLARCEGQPTAFLVERATPGFTTTPITGMVGCRAYMLAALHFDDCRIPAVQLVGRVGVGLSHVASLGLDVGRYGLAWGCVGLAQACLDACLRYTAERRQFGALLREHPLIQRMITRMVVKVTAARLLCHAAGRLRQTRHAAAMVAAAIAKYFASTSANAIAADSVQIHGANGCSSDYPVERYLRDARIMEIIEGTTQVQEMLIARHASVLDAP